MNDEIGEAFSARVGIREERPGCGVEEITTLLAWSAME